MVMRNADILFIVLFVLFLVGGVGVEPTTENQPWPSMWPGIGKMMPDRILYNNALSHDRLPPLKQKNQISHHFTLTGEDNQN